MIMVSKFSIKCFKNLVKCSKGVELYFYSAFCVMTIAPRLRMVSDSLFIWTGMVPDRVSIRTDSFCEILARNYSRSSFQEQLLQEQLLPEHE